MGSGISTEPSSRKSILSPAKLVSGSREKNDQPDMKIFLSFLCGVVGYARLQRASRRSNPSHHVYELRMYHVNEGKMEAFEARVSRSHRRDLQAA